MARIDKLTVGETYAYSLSNWGNPRPGTSYDEFGEFLGIETVEKPAKSFRGKVRTVRMARFRRQGIFDKGEALSGKAMTYDEDLGERVIVDDTDPTTRVLDPKWVDFQHHTPMPFDPDAYNVELAEREDAQAAQKARDRTEAETRLVPSLNFTLGLADAFFRGEVPYELARLGTRPDSIYGLKTEEDQIEAVARGDGRELLRLLACIYEALGVTTDDGEPLVAPKPRREG